jgi:hypothetical protein
MKEFVINLAKDPAGKLIVGLVAAAVFTALYWQFIPVSQATKVIFGLALLTEAYRFYDLDTAAL